MGFSQNFLDYLKSARALKLSQGEADIKKTGAETGKTIAETESEYGRTSPSQANMFAAYAGGQARLMEAGGSTVSKMNTPFGERVTTRPNIGGFFGGMPMGGVGAGGMPMGGVGAGGMPMGGFGAGGMPMGSNDAYAKASAKAKELGGSLSYFASTGSGGYESQTIIPPPKKKPLGNYRAVYG